MTRTPNIVSKYAKRTVFKNKGRSILTLIGIIVATMMFCIVTSAHQSAIDILNSFAGDEYGKWHVEAYSMTSMEYQKVIKDERLNDVAYVQEIGYNDLIGYDMNFPGEMTRFYTQYEYFVGAMSPNFPDLCNLNIVRGRMPQNRNEAIISLEMFSKDKDNLEIGTVISMQTYARYSEGHKVMNLQGLHYSNGGYVNEEIYHIGEEEFTIVGYFAIPEYTKWRNFASNTILTISDGVSAGSPVNAYFEFKDPANYIAFTKDHFEIEDDCLYNKDFIRMEKSADDSRVQFAIGVVSAGTISMIALLAVMLIYNSFSSSSSERLRAIGLLKSVGATRKQVRELMFTEALYYSVIGIPIGILLGQVSSYFLFNALSDMGSNAANYFILKNIDLHYRIGYQNILGPILLSLLTIYAAVLIPVMQVSNVLPMEAVRANESYTQGRDRKKYHALATKIFGFTGGLSLKNYHRYRKRYLATVISIMASIFMILFANMLVRSVTENYRVLEDGSDGKIRYVNSVGNSGFSEEDRAIFYRLMEVDTVKSGSMYFVTQAQMQIPTENLVSQEVKDYIMGSMYNESYSLFMVVFVDDASFRNLCIQNDIDPDPFMEYGSSLCLINNYVTALDEYFRPSYAGKAFSKLPTEIKMDINWSNRPDFAYTLSPVAEVDFSVINLEEGGGINIFLPFSRLEYYHMKVLPGYEIFEIEADRPVSAIAKMKEILQSELYVTNTLEDTGINVRARKAVNSLVRIIMYGYVAMLSFMCFLNVFMTVISNIVFRRKEYILLMSVGMSRKTLFRMVISESFVYFFESLILLFLILGSSLGISMLLLDANILHYISVPYFVVVILVHLLVVVLTTSIGLSRIMRDEIIEGIRKDYY